MFNANILSPPFRHTSTLVRLQASISTIATGIDDNVVRNGQAFWSSLMMHIFNRIPPFLHVLLCQETARNEMNSAVRFSSVPVLRRLHAHETWREIKLRLIALPLNERIRANNNSTSGHIGRIHQQILFQLATLKCGVTFTAACRTKQI